MPEVDRGIFRRKQHTINLIPTPEKQRAELATQACPCFQEGNNDTCCLKRHEANITLFETEGIAELMKKGKEKHIEIRPWKATGDIIIVLLTDDMIQQRDAIESKEKANPDRIWLPEGIIYRKPFSYFGTVTQRSEEFSDAANQMASFDGYSQKIMGEIHHQVLILSPRLRICPVMINYDAGVTLDGQIAVTRGIPTEYDASYPGKGVPQIRPFSTGKGIPFTSPMSRG